MKEIKLEGVKFWITADNKRLNFFLKDVTSRENAILKSNHSSYLMERAVVLVPEFPDNFSYKKLAINNDQNWAKTKGELDGDEWFYNAIWYSKDKAWSIGIHIENEEIFDDITCIGDGLPYYRNINQSVKNKICFEIIYKDRKEYKALNFSYMKQRYEKNKANNPLEQDLSLWQPMNAMHEVLES